MAGLEGIVRPFQQPDRLLRRRVIAATEKVDVQPATLTWGAVGRLPVPQVGVSFALKKDAEHDEVGRQTQKVRVENPDDPSQYIIVERTKSISFRQKRPPTLAAWRDGQLIAEGSQDIGGGAQGVGGGAQGIMPPSGRTVFVGAAPAGFTPVLEPQTFAQDASASGTTYPVQILNQKYVLK